MWKKVILAGILGLSIGKPVIAAHRRPNAKPVIQWEAYRHPAGDYQLRYPKGWILYEQGDSMTFSSPGTRDIRGAFGIIKRRPSWEPPTDPLSEAPDHPANQSHSPVQFGGMPAQRNSRTIVENALTMRLDEYDVTVGSNHYAVIMRAPQDHWDLYAPLFDTIRRHFRFTGAAAPESTSKPRRHSSKSND